MVDSTQMYPSSISPIGLFQLITYNIERLKVESLEPCITWDLNWRWGLDLKGEGGGLETPLHTMLKSEINKMILLKTSFEFHKPCVSLLILSKYRIYISQFMVNYLYRVMNFVIRYVIGTTIYKARYRGIVTLEVLPKSCFHDNSKQGMVAITSF